MATSVPKPIQQALAGTPFHAELSTTSTPGTTQDLITFTVPVGVLRSLTLAQVSAMREGRFTVEADGDVIGSGRTGPGQEPIFWWYPAKPLAAGVEVKLRYTALAQSPPAPIEGYLMAVDTPAP